MLRRGSSKVNCLFDYFGNVCIKKCAHVISVIMYLKSADFTYSQCVVIINGNFITDASCVVLRLIVLFHVLYDTHKEQSIIFVLYGKDKWSV